MGAASRWGTLSRHLLWVAMLMGLMACGGDNGAQAVDCHAHLRFQGVMYEPDNAAIDMPAGPTSPAGKADILGCTEDGWKVIGQTTALKIRGVDVKTAIAVKGDFPGVYVAENTGPNDWPDIIRRK